MDTAITTTYCLIDDWLRHCRHKESPQWRVSVAEIMSTDIADARFFGGNFETMSDLFADPAYLGQGSAGAISNRRLHAVAWRGKSFFDWLSQVHKQVYTQASDDSAFVIDSCPIATCDNTWIDRCRIYLKTAKDDAS